MSIRIQNAVSEGLICLPDEGRIGIFGPRGDMELDGFPVEKTQVIQGFRPDFDHFERFGFNVGTAPDGRFGLAVVVLPRSKVLARHWIAQAAEITDGPVVVDGQKTDGVESLLKDIRKRVDVTGVMSKAHGKLFQFRGGGFDDWYAKAKEIDGFHIAPGIFSADGIDPGSALLARALPAKLGSKVVDLGAGWGYLGHEILARCEPQELHLIEAEPDALLSAQRNLSDSRVRFHWQDAHNFLPDTPVDAVVMNPPFHSGRSVDTALGRAFIAKAAEILARHGRLWMVANRHLPYETTLSERFLNVKEIGGDARYKLFCAEKPRRSGR